MLFGDAKKMLDEVLTVLEDLTLTATVSNENYPMTNA